MTGGDRYNAFLARYESSGKLSWLFRTKGEGVTWFEDLAVLKDGGCLVAGKFQGSLEIEPGKPLKGVGYRHELFAARFDSSGRPLWAKIIPEDRKWVPRELGGGAAIVVDAFPDGSAVVATRMVTTATYEKKWEVGRSVIYWLDSAGKEVRERKYAPDDVLITDISARPSGVVWVAGILKKPLALRGGGCLAPADDYEAFVARLDSSGQFVWGDKISGRGSQSAGRLSAAADGSFVVAGQFGGHSSGGSQVVQGSLYYTFGSYDIYLRSFDPKGDTRWFAYFGSEGHIRHKVVIGVSPKGRIAVAGCAEGGFWFKDVKDNRCQVRKLRGSGVFILGISPEGK
jgi:hypothetical protein